jgi:hypothetical protein
MAEVIENGLPLARAAVLQVRVDYAFTLVLKRGEDAYEVRIEQAFEFATADGVVHTLDPETDPAGLGPALRCTRTAVVAARAFEDGRLDIGFADGSAIRVPVSGEYEGWELAGPDGLRIVAGPGAKLTVWSAEG